MTPLHSPTCTSCGYDLNGLPPGSTCPECGTRCAGVVIAAPITIRQWLAEGYRFARAPRLTLRRPIARGRVDIWISLTNLFLGSVLLCLSAYSPLIARDILQWRGSTTGESTACFAFDLLRTSSAIAAAFGTIMGSVLTAVHRAIVALALTPHERNSRSRTRAVLAASSYSVLLVGVVAIVVSTPLFFLFHNRGASAAGTGAAGLWSMAMVAAYSAAALAALIAASLLSCRAATAKRHPPAGPGRPPSA